MKTLDNPERSQPISRSASSNYVRLSREGNGRIVLLCVLVLVAIVGVAIVVMLPEVSKAPPNPEPATQPDTQTADVPSTEEELEAETFDVAEKLLEAFPISADALNLMANVHNQYDKTKEAAKWWRESIKWAPGRVNAHRGLAMIAMKEGDYGKAAGIWERIRKGNPKHPDANGRYGEAMLEMGKPEEAVEPLEKEVRISPKNADYHFLLGRAHLQLGQYAKAVECYMKAYEISPSDSRTCYGLSAAYARLGQPGKAAEMRKKFQALRSEENASVSERRRTTFNREWTIQTLTRTLTGAGIVYRRNRKFKKAENHWLRAAVLDPKTRICRHELAALYVQQGRKDKAVEICRQLQKAHPKVADYHKRAGLLHEELKQWDLAEAALKKALELAPDDEKTREAYRRVRERR